MARKFETRSARLNGHAIIRVLPRAHRRMVGPFIFIDMMGPWHFPAGSGLDVPPHPHIGLSTLTYLFEGALLHQDSLGNVVTIRPGELNWMTAGKGIVHSERQVSKMIEKAHSLFGMQCWVALPEAQTEIAPYFLHLKAGGIPSTVSEACTIRLIAGSAYGMRSPVPAYLPMFFVDVTCHQNATLPHPAKGQEALLYVLSGEVTLGQESVMPGEFALLDAEDVLQARQATRFLILGGEPWPVHPYIDWNFVAFSKARIEQAKSDWRSRHYPEIPGDRDEFIPLPE